MKNLHSFILVAFASFLGFTCVQASDVCNSIIGCIDGYKCCENANSIW